MLTSFLFFIIVYISFIHIATSSHFYGGTISWRIQDATNTSKIVIFISQTYAWTYTVAPCDTVAIATKKSVTVSAGTLACESTCPPGFGPVATMGYCVDGSSLNNIGVGQRSDTANAPENSTFSVSYRGSAWGGLTIPAGGWSIVSKINLIRRSDTSLFNNAPVAIVMSPINIELNKITVITISVSDPDGDTLRCRWANKVSGNGDECNTICPPTSLPAGTNLSSDCTIQIKGTILNSRYALAVMIEDFINSTSTTPLSSVPLQFLVQVIAPTTCATLPQILYNGSLCTPIQVGETFTAQLFGITNCGPPTTIADIATVSFPGMNRGPVVQVKSQVYSRTLNWTATIDNLGYQVMCTMAIDSNKVQSLQLCLTFYVTVNGSGSCPGKVISSGTTAMLTLPTATLTLPSVTTSITTKAPTSNCVTWPYYTTLAGLGALALLCNCCLLCRYYGLCCGGYPRRIYRRRNSNLDRPVVPRIPLIHLRTGTLVDQRFIPDSICLNRIPLSNEINELNSSTTQSSYLNNHSLRSSNVSPSYTIAINRISQLPSENSGLLSTSEEFHTNNSNNLRSRLVTTVWNQQ